MNETAHLKIKWYFPYIIKNAKNVKLSLLLLTLKIKFQNDIQPVDAKAARKGQKQF